jgi:hypothetical protein
VYIYELGSILRGHAIHMTNQEIKEDLLKACDIGSNIISQSTDLDDKLKAGFLAHTPAIKEVLETLSPGNGLSLYSLKISSTEILTFWNEHIGIDTELFWTSMKANGVRIERKDPLRSALSKKRFRNVDQGMSARKSWEKLRLSDSIVERFSSEEIATLDQIIETDEKTRLRILKKCFLEKKIPQTQYLKFGECYAYFFNCNLFQKYFTTKEVSELYQIWVDFKST